MVAKGQGRSADEAAGKLEDYERKRDFTRTKEPPARRPRRRRGAPRFVVQEHHATALHWDLRLEHGGVGVSWAVPKGLPLDPGRNNLAVHTEDHPLDYFSFEGDIPKGEYGGGAVMIWDSGTYELEEWSEDKVKFVLDGRRVQGRYTLFRTKGDHWMIHRMDPPPTPDWKPLPDLVRPMLAVPGEVVPAGDEWAHEFKWDGVRAVVHVEGGRPRVTSRRDRDVTETYPELRRLAEAMGSTQAVLDGEIVAFDADGRPSFSRLQRRMHVVRPAQIRRLQVDVPVHFLVFDLLHLEGRPLLSEPYDERRRLLESLQLDGPCWATPPSFTGNGDDVLAAGREQGLEGVVSKRRDSRYYAGRRSDCWVKVKIVASQDVVICGWEPGEGRRGGGIGALLLGVHTSDGLVYAGQVGTGFTEALLRDLQHKLAPLERRDPPYDQPVPREQTRYATWVEPQLVAEVGYTQWTPEGRLRNPSFRGLRNDRDPREVTREP